MSTPRKRKATKKAAPPVEGWPSCESCGGPRRPEGSPALRARFEVETRSEANERSRWAKIERADAQREATVEALAVALGEGQKIPEVGPWFVRITRIAPNDLDDDNLGRSLKRIRDVVAKAIRIDDGSKRIRFDPQQRREGRFLGCEIEIWGAPA